MAFTTQPPSTVGINTSMPNVVVSAIDIHNNRDVDATGTVTIVSTGTMTGTTATANFISGQATFTNIIHTVAQTARNLTASRAGWADVNSTLFDVTTITYVNGDYKTTGTGNWTNGGASTIWQRITPSQKHSPF